MLLVVAGMLLFFSCSNENNGPIQSMTDLQNRVTRLNDLNTKLETNRGQLYGLIRDYNKNLPESSQFDITSMDTVMGSSERELLRAMFKEEKDISYNGLLKTIITKNEQIAKLQENIAELESRLPVPYNVRRGDTHYEIVINYLTNQQGLSRKEAHKTAFQTALIDDLLPGNQIWMMYKDGIVGTFVTQGNAKISPMKMSMLAKKRLLEKSKGISYQDNTGQSGTIN
jgi:hypothetical protein